MRRVICCAIATLVVLNSVNATAADESSIDLANTLANELALVERWLEAQRAYDHVPGFSAAVVHDQQLLWTGASGFADVASGTPASADTIYGICSISKLFTGIALLQLRDQGKLNLDDKIHDHLPWFDLVQAHEGSPDITLRAVLTHSAGLPRESDSPYWMGPDFPFPTRAAIREKLGEQSTLYPAQRYYQYSNLGLSLAGEVVAAVSGKSYEDYVQQHILKPLGLPDTHTGFPTDAREPRIATGYGYPGRDLVAPVMPRYDTRGITPAAGFSSTVTDLAAFATWQFRLLAGESDGVLAANTLREMQRVQWMDHDWSAARGLAFGVYREGERTLTGHGGDCPGFNTRLYLDPLSQYAVVTMANRNRTEVDKYAAAIFDILEAGGGPSTDDITTLENTPSAPALGDYLGNYDLRPWDGENLVFRWNDGLAMITLPTMDPLAGLERLQHIEGDRFHTVRKDGQQGYEVLFRRAETGVVTHVVFHSIDLPKR